MIDAEDIRTLVAYTILALALGVSVLYAAAVLAVVVRLFLYLSGV